MEIISRNILITGAAGFIGFHLCMRLLTSGCRLTGLDNLNDYYDVQLKSDRLDILKAHNNFVFYKSDLADHHKLESIFRDNDIDVVVNLAAQAGVRYSLINPRAYVDSNLVGFTNILECCRRFRIKHLVFASSSSVYGANTKMPFSVHHHVDHPISLYAATKKSNELMAHAYSHLYDLPCTGLRFFTIYGPWGRPDMALFIFVKSILEERSIKVFNQGKMQRDFTYIDDIIEGCVRIIGHLPKPNLQWSGHCPDPGSSYAPYRIYNIGNNKPVQLLDFINTLESALGQKAIIEFMEMQPGDIPMTYADVDDLMQEVGFKPATPIEEGIKRFVEWYKEYYRIG